MAGGVQEIERAHYVVLCVEDRVLHGARDIDLGGAMDHYVGVTDQDVDQACVTDVAFNEVGLFRIRIDGGREVIENGNDMAFMD